MPYDKDVIIIQTTLIANMGGVMELCMGFSLISLVEIIYYFIINPILVWIEKMSERQTKAGNQEHFLTFSNVF